MAVSTWFVFMCFDILNTTVGNNILQGLWNIFELRLRQRNHWSKHREVQRMMTFWIGEFTFLLVVQQLLSNQPCLAYQKIMNINYQPVCWCTQKPGSLCQSQRQSKQLAKGWQLSQKIDDLVTNFRSWWERWLTCVVLGGFRMCRAIPMSKNTKIMKKTQVLWTELKTYLDKSEKLFHHLMFWVHGEGLIWYLGLDFMLMAPAINVQGLYPCWQRCRRDSAAGMIFVVNQWVDSKVVCGKHTSR